MRKLAALVLASAALFGLALPASAGPSDKPVVTVGRLSVRDGGGVSPDTWYTQVTVPVGGSNFTAGGNVYVTFQDITAGTAAVNGEWTTASTGPCGLECNNSGKISYSRSLTFGYRAVCGHWLRTWAWDEVKGPQHGYGWSSSDTQVTCS